VAFSLALSAEGQLLASGSAEGTVRLWETRRGQPLSALEGQTAWPLVLSMATLDAPMVV